MRDLCYLSIFHNHTYNRYAILLHLKIEGNIQDLKPLNLKVHSNGRFVMGIENVVTKSENMQAINQAKNTRSVVQFIEVCFVRILATFLRHLCWQGDKNENVIDHFCYWPFFQRSLLYLCRNC